MESSSSKQASAPWRPRKYVLVGMGVILGASALITITSIILQPAIISFTTTDFSVQATNSSNNQVYFAFKLTSHNPSHRAGLVYRYISVSVQLQHNQNPSVRKTSVPALVRVPNYGLGLQQERNSSKTMAVEAFLDDRFYSFYSSNASATIMLFAQAWFKVGLARTRLYNIRVRCQRVDLLLFSEGNHLQKIANCSAA